MMLPKYVTSAIDAFDKAAHEHAFRGTHTGSPREAEVVDWYERAKRQLENAIATAMQRQYASGEEDGISRARSRPGDGDMGG